MSRYSLLPLRTLPYRALYYFRNRYVEVKNKLIDRLIYKPKVLARVNGVDFKRRKPKNREIVFVSDRPRSREAKLAYGLMKAGWTVILYYQVEPNYDPLQFFAKTIRYKHSWQALYLAMDYNPVAFHVFTLWDYTTAYLFNKYKPGKVVIDINDTLKGTASDEFLKTSSGLKRFLPMEKYVIENADGLCCRDLQVKNLSRKENYKSTKKSIFFPEYCWDSHTKKNVLSNGDIHIVLIGHFGLKAMGDEREAGYWDIINAIIAQKIHFHIYPHWFYKRVYFKAGYKTMFSDYFQLDEENPYFHIHPAVSVTEVVKEISRYDFGIHVMRAVLFQEKYKRYTPEAMKICTSSRVSDYIDAELPVISTNGTYIYKYLKRYGVMADLNKENLYDIRNILKPLLNSSVQSDLHKLRKKLSLSRHAHRLVSFYEQL